MSWMFFLQHETMYLGDESPVFAGLDSFLTHNAALASRAEQMDECLTGKLAQEEMCQRVISFAPDLIFPDECPSDSSGMQVDFPTLDENARTSNVYEECRLRLNAKTFDSEDEREFLIFSSVRTCPAQRVEECELFLHDEDTTVAGHVPRIMAACDNSAVHRMFVRGATLEWNEEPMPLFHLLARMALRNPDSTQSILQAFESENRDPSDFQASLKELIENPPVHF